MRVGGALLEVVRPAPPCRLMDDAVGPGAARAMHDRGGSILRVLVSGDIAVGEVLARAAARRPLTGPCTPTSGNSFARSPSDA